MGFVSFSEDIVKNLDDLKSEFSVADSYEAKMALYEQIKSVFSQLEKEIEISLEYVTAPDMPNRDLVMENQSLESQVQRLKREVSRLTHDYNDVIVKNNKLSVDLRKSSNAMSKMSTRNDFLEAIKPESMGKRDDYREKAKPSAMFNPIQFHILK